MIIVRVIQKLQLKNAVVLQKKTAFNQMNYKSSYNIVEFSYSPSFRLCCFYCEMNWTPKSIEISQMNISDQPSFKLWTREDIKKEINAIRERNPAAFRNWESKCEWEETDDPEALNYLVYEDLELKKNEIYMEVEKQPTFWECRDDTDGFLVHKNVTKVVVDGKYLTVFYDGKKQDYRIIKKFQRYDKLIGAIKTKNCKIH